MLGWYQHKVTSGDILMVNHDVGAKIGQRIKLDKVLLIGSKDFTLMVSYSQHFHFLCNLEMGTISSSVFPWQASPEIKITPIYG